MAKGLRVACIQMDCTPCDVTVNNRKAEKLIDCAADSKAKLIVLPELYNVGYDLDMIKKAENGYTQTIAMLSQASRKHNVYIAAGILEYLDDKFYNSVFVFSNGDVVCKYRKVHLFPLSKENDIFEEGRELVTFSVDEFKFGIMICYDIRFPEMPAKYVKEGCSGLIIASAFPFPRLDHWRVLLRARAIENQLYLAAANRVGNDNGIWFAGNSCIIDPWGTVKSTLNETEEGIIVEDIDLNKVLKVRADMPCLRNK